MDSLFKYKHSAENLLIILNEGISNLINKGEITPRYYNPGEVFKNVHFILLNNDKPNLERLKLSVGDAVPYIHNFPVSKNLLIKSIGYQQFLLKSEFNGITDIARKIKPDLIRCHVYNLDGLFSVHLKKKLNVPAVLSVHATKNWDRKFGSRKPANIKQFIMNKIDNRLDKIIYNKSDVNIAVYTSIKKYIESYLYDKSKVNLIFNVLSDRIKPKDNYEIKEKFKLMCIGHQNYTEKNPKAIIEAVSKFEKIELYLIGGGPQNNELRNLATQLNANEKIKFLPYLANEEIVKLFTEIDAYIFNELDPGISKTIIEAGLAAVPVIHNKRNFEYSDDDFIDNNGVILVENSVDGYTYAIEKLYNQPAQCEKLGKLNYEFALNNWKPSVNELKYAELYLELLKKYNRI